MNEEITLMDRIKKLYRPVGKITDYIPLSAAITFILVLVSSMVGLFITAWLLPPAQTRSPAMQMFAMYFNTIGAWVVALLLILILPGNHKMLKAAGPGMKGNTLKWILYGILIGFGANTFCVLMSILFKASPDEDEFLEYLKTEQFDVILGDPMYRMALKWWDGTFLPLPQYSVSGEAHEALTEAELL